MEAILEGDETIAPVPPAQQVPLPDDDLSTRYGRTSPVVRRAIAVFVIFVASLALVWLAWVAWFQSTPDVESELQGFDIVSDHSTVARVTVQLDDADIEARCLVRALGNDHSVVGEVNFKVTGTNKRMLHTIDIRTERRTNAVELVGCSTDRQKRPR
ncbi:MAG: DUF4307 domain-containing protein [Marmoricola sp.]